MTLPFQHTFIRDKRAAKVGKIIYKRPRLTDYQEKIVDSQYRYTVCEASTKAGKTMSHIVWLFEESLTGSLGQQFWWVAPVYKQSEIAFNRMKNFIRVRNGRRFFVANKTKLNLTLPSGAIISFRSADNPDNLYGDDVYAVVFDEYSRAKETAWHAIRSALTATNGSCKFIGNVLGATNWGHRLAIQAKMGLPNYEYHKITAYDAVAAGILKLEEVEQAKAELPEAVFLANYMAEATEDGANPFGLANLKKCTIAALSNKPAIVYGVDLAKKVDYTVVIGLDEDRNMCYFDRFQTTWRITREKLLALADTSMLVDCTGVGDPIVEDLQAESSFVEGYQFTTNSKKWLIEKLILTINRHKIGICGADDEVVLDELENFEMIFDKNIKYSAPEGLHDDCVMALALANEAYDRYELDNKKHSKIFIEPKIGNYAK